MRISVTGHMNITEATASLVEAAIRDHLERLGSEVIGISCIARGADSVFAKAVLNAGGALEVILPSVDYRAAKVKPDHAPLFDALLAKATTVRTLPFATANRDAYVAANNAMLDSADELVRSGTASPHLIAAGPQASLVTLENEGFQLL